MLYLKRLNRSVINRRNGFGSTVAEQQFCRKRFSIFLVFRGCEPLIKDFLLKRLVVCIYSELRALKMRKKADRQGDMLYGLEV
ncbi:hypothetical protein EQO05_13040 [Methanosarcina sp. MSH10X1]|nr:hypothetical protein EQO05_13040 [Methanosarcina sp. MSH10X1]